LILRHSLIKYHIASIVWASIILLLSGLPSSNFPELSFWNFLTFDKFAHALFYAIFVVLVAIGEVKHHRFSSKRSMSIIKGFTVGMVFGLLMEIFQAFVFIDRSADWADVVANTFGCLIGVIYFKWNFSICLNTLRW